MAGPRAKSGPPQIYSFTLVAMDAAREGSKKSKWAYISISKGRKIGFKTPVSNSLMLEIDTNKLIISKHN